MVFPSLTSFVVVLLLRDSASVLSYGEVMPVNLDPPAFSELRYKYLSIVTAQCYVQGPWPLNSVGLVAILFDDCPNLRILGLIFNVNLINNYFFLKSDIYGEKCIIRNSFRIPLVSSYFFTLTP